MRQAARCDHKALAYKCIRLLGVVLKKMVGRLMTVDIVVKHWSTDSSGLVAQS